MNCTRTKMLFYFMIYVHYHANYFSARIVTATTIHLTCFSILSVDELLF